MRSELVRHVPRMNVVPEQTDRPRAVDSFWIKEWLGSSVVLVV